MLKALCCFMFLIIFTFCRYHLVIYEAIDCPYCKFATGQIRSLMSEYHLQNMVKLTVIDCDMKISLCRDNINRPLLVLANSKGQKIKQIGGVHSKLYFRDWILNVVDRNPLKIQQSVYQGTQKKKIIANREEVVQYFNKYIQRQIKIQNDKFDIFAQASKLKLANKTQTNKLEGSEQFISNGKFHYDLRSIAVIIPIISLIFMLALKKCQNDSYNKKRQSRLALRIPEQQDFN